MYLCARSCCSVLHFTVDTNQLYVGLWGHEDLMIVFRINCVNYSAENELFWIKAKWLHVVTCEGCVKQVSSTVSTHEVSINNQLKSG